MNREHRDIFDRFTAPGMCKFRCADERAAKALAAEILAKLKATWSGPNDEVNVTVSGVLVMATRALYVQPE